MEIVDDLVNEPTEVFGISARLAGSATQDAVTTVIIVDDDGKKSNL